MITALRWNILYGSERPFGLYVNNIFQRVYSRDELKVLGPEYDDVANRAINSMQPEKIHYKIDS